ncbi:MAG: hypothetical protein IJ802_06550 [Kiritimatiellae bacterium]|nr:hypothetical protein [Kiritimatiellia bacterium]
MKMLGKTIAAAIAAVVLSAGARGEEKALCVWKYPAVAQQHKRLVALMQLAIARGDTAMFENVARAGVALIPGDKLWHYNLACALAYKADPAEALKELAKAIRWGLRDAKMIESDRDFARLRRNERFAALVKEAKDSAAKPVEGKVTMKPTQGVYGQTLTVTEANAAWDFERACFVIETELKQPPETLAAAAAKYTGPAAAAVCKYLAEGTGAGNGGDLYLNRDRGHSVLRCGAFPWLTPVAWERAAMAERVDENLPNASFPGHTVFANVSRTRVGVAGRSFARAAMTDEGAAERLAALYLDNNLFVCPAVDDYGTGKFGDVFPARVPFLTATLGRSYTDTPILEAFAAASAALRPQTKRAIVRQGMMGTVMQWLMRSTMRGVKTQEDYLEAGAHPVVFSKDFLDTGRMVEKAHALKIADVPPAAKLELVNSRIFPVKMPMAGVDYPDVMPEAHFLTPVANLIVLRAKDAKRTFFFRARTDNAPDDLRQAKFAWKVLGNPLAVDAVKIEPPAGDIFSTPETGLAQITVDRENLHARVDVAVFAKFDGTEWGAPAFISFMPVPQELRAYLPDGRIDWIDYSNPMKGYIDPAIAAPRPWKDSYVYDKAGRIEKVQRSIGGEITAEFLPDGRKITRYNPDGSAAAAVKVKYVLRENGNRDVPVDLVCVEDGREQAIK